MSRKLILIAAVLVGSLFAVGCGPTPTSSGGTAPSGGREGSMADEAKRKKLEEGKKTIEDSGKKLADAAGGKVKELQDEINKELEPVNKKIAELKKKVEEEKDAGAKAEASKMLAAGETKLKEVMDLVKNSFTADKLKALTEGDAFAKLKETIMKAIGELKKSVGL